MYLQWDLLVLSQVKVKCNNMKNDKLKEITETYTGKSNKELSTILMTLHHDFTELKNHMLSLGETMTEIESTYNKVYSELQKRLKFETPKITEDVDGD